METPQQFIQRKNEQFKKSKPIRMKDIGRKGWHLYTREAWTFMPESTIKEKVLVLERLRLSEIQGTITHQEGNKIGKIVYRIGYFMIGKNGNRKGKWVWGQFCPIIPANDLNKLMSKAKKKELCSKPMHPTNTYLVARHAESENNVLNRENSRLINKDKYSLTQKGQQYAQKQADQYHQTHPNSPIHLIFTSPFRRAYETAEPFSNIHKIPIQTDDRLAEVNVGIFDEKPYEIVDQFYLDNAETVPCPQGESLAQAKARTLDFITEINAKHTNKTILIISHGYINKEIIKAFIPDFDWDKYQQTHDHSRKIFEIPMHRDRD